MDIEDDEEDTMQVRIDSGIIFKDTLYINYLKWF